MIHYYAVNRYEAVNWTFDKNFYMGYEIEKLTFSQADPEGIEYPKNIIKIDLTLTCKKYGSYHSTRYVECYNFVSILILIRSMMTVRLKILRRHPIQRQK